MGNGDKSPCAQAAEATERPRLGHQGWQTHSEIRLGLSGHRPANSSVQQRESRHPELFPLCGQLGPTATHPVYPAILAGKHSRTKVQNLDAPSVFKRFGKNLTYVIKDKAGNEKKTVSCYLNHDWGKNRDAFQSRKQTDTDLIRTERYMRSRSKIAKPCGICGDTMDKAQIVMHHVRHIRKLSDKRPATGFNRI